MPFSKLIEPGVDRVYKELLEEFPEASPEAIETALQFHQVAASMNLRREAMFNRFGLTAGRFTLLMLLRRESSRSLSPSALAERTGVTRATMTQFLDALEKDGLVRRACDPEDRRARQVQLTPRGGTLLKRVLPELLRGLGLMTGTLTLQERRQLLSLFEKISSGMRGPGAR